ncbi:M23 family metallopeptidase [Chiayiivirga flava]|uniref:M23 family metallopeptidase n=1 Tax=Chiayiivirga flava TaxID=659595 RepID=UPI001FE63A15|nr:M23 family metallopeptidase [Chiayiivirga flava]
MRRAQSDSRFGRFVAVALAIAAALAGTTATAANTVTLPERASQGQLLVGQTTPGSTVKLRERTLKVDPDGHFVFGIGRDEARNAPVDITFPDGETRRIAVQVLKRDWPIERVNGVPQSTVDPPPAIAARIAREQAAVAKERSRDDARSDFAQGFVWPVQGRISGRFGRQRIYNGSPNAPHSGTDIAAPAGTAVRAPAAGIVTFADRDLYLTGGTLLIDHGHGVSSSFLHLSRIDVSVGQRVERGETVAAVGATGRATGPHLHWGLNWLDVRLDPQLLELPPPGR